MSHHREQMIFRAISMLVFFVLLLLVTRSSLRRVFPSHYEKLIRPLLLMTSVVGVAGFLLWFLGRGLDIAALAGPGMALAAVTLVTAFITALAMPPTLMLGSLRRRWGSLIPGTSNVDTRRRRFLGLVTAGVPATAAASGPIGGAATLLPAVIRNVQIPVRALDERLEGLKILQLTDIHLGTFIDATHVRDVLEIARPHAPDVIVLTGDIADDYSKLPEALSYVASMNAPLGAFACIGNHEVYRGRKAAEDIYATTDVTLLTESGVVLERNGARLFLGGVDDPARLGGDHRAYLDESVARTMKSCPNDVDARILMSHRPEGFEAAARHGVDLTLSGHTHGGQIALFGRSVFEPLAPRAYLKGHYQSGASHLYTSSGLGHWFPFRMNCPCEAALITLVRTV